MSYLIPLTSIAPRVFVVGAELQLLLVRKKRAQSIQLKMFILYILGNLATRFGRNGLSPVNIYIKIYKEEFSASCLNLSESHFFTINH
jgi:hypothetical protein